MHIKLNINIVKILVLFSKGWWYISIKYWSNKKKKNKKKTYSSKSRLFIFSQYIGILTQNDMSNALK